MKLSYPRWLLLIVGVILLLCARLSEAGEYVFIAATDEKVAFSYTGEVTSQDAEMLDVLARAWSGYELIIHIDSPGGLAYEGVELYWMAKRHNVTTVAGHHFGAYSAAALFWLGGGDKALTVDGSIVGFHLAYCNPYNPPGCPTADVDGEFYKILIDSLGRKAAHELWGRMLSVLDVYGSQGFVLYKQVEGTLVIVETIPTAVYEYGLLSKSEETKTD